MKKLLLGMVCLLSFTFMYGQSTLYLTTSGGSYPGEKWVDITTGPDGTGTVLWAQGDGTYGNGAGLLTDEPITIMDGTNYYINCYDSYDDGWDGTTYTLRSAASGGGLVVANNGGASPTDGNDQDATGGVFDDRELERESSEMFSYTPPACAPGAGTAEVGSCDPANGIMINVNVTDLGDGTIVIQNDGGVADVTVTSTGTTMLGPFAFSSTVTVTLAHPTDAVCNVVLPAITLASGCPPANDVCTGAVPITPSPAGTGCASAGFTLNFSSDNTTDSGLDGSCNNTDTGLDQFFTWTATSTGLIFNSNSTAGNPGIVIRSNDGSTASPMCGAEIACATTFANNVTLNGWNIGDELIIQIYDYAGSVADVAFCLEEEAACADPTGLSATNITETTVDISWTSASGCSGEEYWVLPTGSAAPTIGSGTTVTCGGGITAMSLTGETTYDVWVFTVCVGGNAGPINLGSFTTLATPPANDNCAGAIGLTVNADDQCASTTSGTVANATASPEDATACSGTENDDVWYSFVATSTTHLIELQNVAGSTTDLYHSLWEGSCGSLTQIGTCSDPDNSTQSGLTIGNTYYLRVNSWTSTAGQTTTFDVCVGTPPPPPVNDDCAGAIDLATESSPLTGNNCSATNSFASLSCLSSGSARDLIYKIDVPNGATLTIQQTTNDYDSKHRLAYGANCPGDMEIACTDDPDETIESWTNTTGSMQTVYWVQSAYSTGCGDFTLEWSISACPAANSLVATDVTDSSASLAWTSTGTCNTDEYWILPAGSAAPTTGGVNAACNGGVMVSGLSAETEYDVWVNTACTVGSSGPTNIGSFTTTVGAPDCSSATMMVCGGTYSTGDLSGAGAWNPDGATSGACFATPGKEIVFQYLVENSGDHSIDVNLVSGSDSWNDFFYRTDGMCEEANWICLDDVATANPTLSIPGLTAGETLYILVDSETAGAGRIHEFTLNCPPAPISTGSIGSCTSASSVMSTGSGDKLYLTDASGNVVAAFMDSEAMGTVNASFWAGDATDNSLREYIVGDIPMIDRSIVITPSSQPAAAVTVFLYYTTAEADELFNTGAAGDWNGSSITKFDTDDCNDLANPSDLGGDLIPIVNSTQLADGWEIEISISSFSGFQAASGSAALPVKLDKFSAKQDGRMNKVEWTTVSEINVDHHTVMKSNDGINWTDMTQVDGQVNSTNTLEYSVMDQLPYPTTYYKLRMTDLDGSMDYSAIVSVTRDSEGLSSFLGASPVPTADKVSLNIFSQSDDNIQITLMDLSGKVIQSFNRNIAEGNHQISVDLQDYQSGVYIVNLKSDYIQETTRVIKQ